MRTISRTNYLVDEASLGRYSLRTNFAGLVERNIYVDPEEDQARVENDDTASRSTTGGAMVKRGTGKRRKARKSKAMLALLIAAQWDPLESTCRHASLSIL